MRTMQSSEDTSWFFTEEWQQGERKADEDLAQEQYIDFETVEELLTYLNAARLGS